MGGSCPEGQYRDLLVKTCIHCQVACQWTQVPTRCISYCASAHCKKLPGHYYDRLLKQCIKCAEICGRHPPQCSQHCLTTSPLGTSKTLKVTSRLRRPGDLSPPVSLDETTTVLLYSLLALCLLLLFSSFSLALTVFLRRSRGKTATLAAKATTHKRERAVLPGEEVGVPQRQPALTSKDCLTTSRHPTEQRAALDKSSPTETCVCVHCFPDLRDNDRPPKVSSALHQPAALPQAIQDDRPLWTDGGLHTSGFRGACNTGLTSICCLSDQSASQGN
ncbi:tumor necrosis factor receptor superfamily member 13B [Solea solea]|uniref:tumor necrosis factor receptor superfamily member 13B n=1 Tax=Solea solea TaxID=90069 RepID=UPI00272A52FD|nr:tumor necrosis factor receptor superfamily member 13B [Solea solea]XP_058477436.1 tumor necrosis factor receptor superfamily member 13B [Solea solea]